VPFTHYIVLAGGLALRCIARHARQGSEQAEPV